MTSIFIDALIKFPRPGFNRFERDRYYQEFQSNQEQVQKLKKFAEKVASESDMSSKEVINHAFNVDMSQPGESKAESVSQLYPWLDEMAEMSSEIELKGKHYPRRVATLMLASRLPVEWVLENHKMLEDDYFIELPEDAGNKPKDATPDDVFVDYNAMKLLPKPKWLASSDRWKLMEAITDMLPSVDINEIYEFTITEFRDGKPPEQDEEPETLVEQVGKPQSELRNAVDTAES